MFCSSTRFAFLRCIPCLKRETGLANEIMTKSFEKLIMILVSIAYIQVMGSVNINPAPGQEIIMALHTAVIYGCFNKLYHDPVSASIASLVLLYR